MADFQSGIDILTFKEKYVYPRVFFEEWGNKEAICFFQSPEFTEILKMESELSSQEVQEINRKFSGKLSIRIPKTLHKRLADESKNEGTSLNQLILYKLSCPV